MRTKARLIFDQLQPLELRLAANFTDLILAALQVNVPRTIGILHDTREIVISRNRYASKRQIIKQ